MERSKKWAIARYLTVQRIYRYSWKVLAGRCEAVSRLSEGTAGYDDLEIEPTNSDSCTVSMCFVHFRRFTYEILDYLALLSASHDAG